MRTLLLLLFVFAVISCEIKLDGNRFYSVKGKLVDSLNQPIIGHELKVISSVQADLVYYESVVLNKGRTDANGFFTLYYPGSSSNSYLAFESDFYKYDSISSNGYLYGYESKILLNENNNPKNIFDLGTIKIKQN